MKLNKYLKKKQDEIRLSKKKFADEIGINTSWLFDLENDEDEINWLNLTQFGNMCKALQIKPSELFHIFISDIEELSLGELFKKRREEIGWSIENLGERIGYEQSVIANIENNKNTNEICIDVLKKTASQLNIPFNLVLNKLESFIELCMETD